MKNKSEPRLPKHLLDVTVSPSTVRLCRTDEMSVAVHYVALLSMRGSGIDGISQTSSENLVEFEDGQLPSTFQDAVAAARQLGIRYLWIDSLCIIQGNQDDFMEEVGNMESIFSNAYCVLSASSAPSITDGFLTPRRQRGVVSVKAADGVPIFVCELIDNFHGDVDGSLLSSRGWAFQERILSRRMIFFTSTQMYWQCGEEIRCETLTKMSK
jgi:hypothetical protein